MGQKVKVAGTWRDASPYVKVGGSWKLANEVWVKVDGEWRVSLFPGGVGGVVDTTWDSQDTTGPLGVFATDYVNAIKEQSDGKILVGGRFSRWSGSYVGRLVRLNSDRTRDTAFSTNVDLGANNSIEAIELQSDGKILVGGSFSSWDGTSVGRIARLNSDGTRDTAFTTNNGTGANNIIYSIAFQSDGKILAGGNFTSWNGTTVGRIVRLNSDGTLDTTFNTNVGTAANNSVRSIAVQSDGKIVIGGNFTIWKGIIVGRIVRLESNGTIDSSFTSNILQGANSQIRSIVIQPNQQILVGGEFLTWSGATARSLVRLNANGTRETQFSTNLGTISGQVFCVDVQSDGKILISGTLSSINSVFGTLFRLNSNGSRDTSFTLYNPNSTGGPFAVTVLQNGNIAVGGYAIAYGHAAGFFAMTNSSGVVLSDFIGSPQFGNGEVTKVSVNSSQQIVLGGQFVSWNSSPVGYLTRINNDGTQDSVFVANVGSGATTPVTALHTQTDNKILIGGAFSSFNGTSVGRFVRLNSNGSIDSAFSSNVGAGSNSTTFDTTTQADGQILVGGAFTSWNGVTVGRIVRLYSDGNRDVSFSTLVGGGANNSIFSICCQSDGKILIGGQFTSWNGVAVNRIVRLNPTGTQDTSFSTNIGTGPNSSVSQIAVQSDGKIVIVGFFTAWNGVSVGRVVRLNPDGTLDSSFISQTGTGAQNVVRSVLIQSYDRIVLGGDFWTWNGNSAIGLLRLKSDGQLDNNFVSNLGYQNTSTSVYCVDKQEDGKLIVGGRFVFFGAFDKFRRFLVRVGGGVS